MILTSATDELASSFSLAARDLIEEHGPSYFGVRLRGDMSARRSWALEQGGSLRAAGIGSSIMGRGADVLVVDDYFGKVEEALSEVSRKRLMDWFFATSSTRLTPIGAIVIVATRWHPKDLIGQLIDQQQDGGEKYRVVNFPAVAEEADELGRKPGDPLWVQGGFDGAWLTRKEQTYRVSGYPWMWEALYQQHPPDVLDCEFPREYFEDHIWFHDWPSDIGIKVMALDPSLGKTSKADYSAFVMLAVDQQNPPHLWIDADVERLRNTDRTVQRAIELTRQFRPQVFGVESNQFQEVLREVLFSAFQASGIYPEPIQIINLVEKRGRIRGAVTTPLAQHRLHFRKGSPGVSLLLEQLKGFPTCKHDDGPDALSMAILKANELWCGSPLDNLGPEITNISQLGRR